jgi:hypothetical protein
MARARSALEPVPAIMTPQDIQSVLKAGTAVKVFFDSHIEVVFVISIDPDGMLCRPVAAGLTGAAGEFWLAYDQISQIEPAD